MPEHGGQACAPGAGPVSFVSSVSFACYDGFMSIKPSAAPSARRAGVAPRRAGAPLVELSFDVAPVVSVVRRHVKLSKQAEAAIRLDLANVLNHAIVQLRVAGLDAPAPAPPADDPVLSTEQAAQLAGVSRPYMAKLIDTGKVKQHQKVGRQRRVLRSAVLSWQQNERVRQAGALKRLAADLDEEIFPS